MQRGQITNMDMDKAIEFVRERATYHDTAVAKTLGNPANPEHVALARRFSELTALLEEIRRQAAATERGAAVNLLPEDLRGLPQEVLRELGLSESDEQELEILKLIEQAGGTISLDVLIVRWYRAKNEVIKRRAMTSRLYRMQQKGTLFGVPGTKGVYTLHPTGRRDQAPDETEAQGDEST